MTEAASSRAQASPVARRHRRHGRLRLPIAAVLVGGFGLLMLAAVASVLALGLGSAGRNTFALLGDKANLALDGVSVRVRHQLDPARNQALHLADLIARGAIDPADRPRMLDTLRAALAGTPQVTGIGFIPPDLTALRIARVNGELLTLEGGAGDPAAVRAALAEAAQRQGAWWADPLWSAELHTSVLTLRLPVRRGDRFLGMLAVAVSLGDLSRFLSELFLEQNINAFVLYDRSHVIAQQALPYLQFDFSGRTDEVPLPRIDQVDDPVLAQIWSRAGESRPISPEVKVRSVVVGGEEHVFLLRPLEGYGVNPWTIGIVFRYTEVNAELSRLWRTGIVGFAILLVSVAVALLVGRTISRQIGRLAAAAESVGALDFGNAPQLPDSRFRELSDAASAFNAMVAGLSWFETYVPKGLVLRLIRRGAPGGRIGALASEERTVTVMFTDIRGFTALAEHLTAGETADLLNHHFTLLSSCVEATGGTVDKFIGDAVMAFWGAPEIQADHAARALRAAQAMVESIRADNRLRVARGQRPVRLRIGLHSGTVVVGNIGSASRINYTIVGDTVNIAARIEELGCDLQGDGDIIVLTSGATAEAAAAVATAEAGAGTVPLRPIGPRRLRGRGGTIEVHRLEQDPPDPVGAGTPQGGKEGDGGDA